MPGDYAFNWAAVGIAALMGFGGVASFFVISWVLAPRRATSLSAIAYECGIIPTGEGKPKIATRRSKPDQRSATTIKSQM